MTTVKNELEKIKESYDLGLQYFESEIFGQQYKIRMNKDHKRNSYRNDDDSYHNLSLVSVAEPSAVVFRTTNEDTYQMQVDKIYNWSDAEIQIEEFFSQIDDLSNN